MKKLIMMIGFPRSGKSTIAKSLGFPIVNPDAIRLAIHGHAFLSRAEPLVWAIAKIMVRSLFEAGHDRVILDACNNTKKRRAEWKSWEGEWVREYYVVDTSETECIDRVLNDEDMSAEMGDELVNAIERMAKQHESIQEEERDL